MVPGTVPAMTCFQNADVEPLGTRTGGTSDAGGKLRSLVLERRERQTKEQPVPGFHIEAAEPVAGFL